MNDIYNYNYRRFCFTEKMSVNIACHSRW